MRRRRTLLTALACVSWLLGAEAATAQPQKKPPGKLDPKMAEAKRLFDEGADLYTRGSYEEAIDAWEKSYEISKKPLIFESIANAYERLGKPKQARDYLGRWRAAAPPDEHELLDARLKKLDERVAREEASDAARKAEEDKTRQEEEQRAAAERARQQPDKPPPTEPTSSDPIAGFVLVGGGIGAVLVGVTLDIVAAARRPDSESACKAAGDRQICSASEKDAIESSNTLATVGDILWIAGSAAAFGGLLLIANHHDAPREEKPKAARFVPVATPHGGGFALTGRF